MRRPGIPAPLRTYRRLLRAYGPQGWWPVTPARGRRPRCRPGGRSRLSPAQRREVCAGAILTQNTNWSNVEKALARLRGAGLRDLAGLTDLPQRRLQSLVRCSGYFRQKARKLKVFMRHLQGRGGDVARWLSGDLPARRQELLGIFGIGPETADSILLYAADRPAFVIDAYTLRIGRRLGWFRHADYHRAQCYLTRRLPRDHKLYNEFHALLVALAKAHCRTKPICAGCPLAEVCGYAPS